MLGLDHKREVVQLAKNMVEDTVLPSQVWWQRQPRHPFDSMMD